MVFMASISLEASPPEAILARGRGGSPRFSEIKNSTESIPVPLNAKHPDTVLIRQPGAWATVADPNRHTVLRGLPDVYRHTPVYVPRPVRRSPPLWREPGDSPHAGEPRRADLPARQPRSTNSFSRAFSPSACSSLLDNLSRSSEALSAKARISAMLVPYFLLRSRIKANRPSSSLRRPGLHSMLSR